MAERQTEDLIDLRLQTYQRNTSGEKAKRVSDKWQHVERCLGVSFRLPENVNADEEGLRNVKSYRCCPPK